MSACLLKALKAVDLERHIDIFRSLGYHSAGALTQFHTEHFEHLNLQEQELLRLISLLDVLKETSANGTRRNGNFRSSLTVKQPTTKRSTSVHAIWSDGHHQRTRSKLSIERPTGTNSVHFKTSQVGHSSMNPISSQATPSLSRDFVFQQTSTVPDRSPRITSNRFRPARTLTGKSFLNRPSIQHVKVY
jgi:hypothetical protein